MMSASRIYLQKITERKGKGKGKFSIPRSCTPGQRPGLNTLDAGRRVGVGGEGDFGFVICDFILGDWYISGVSGPRVEPGAKRGGGPGGARAVF